MQPHYEKMAKNLKWPKISNAPLYSTMASCLWDCFVPAWNTPSTTTLRSEGFFRQSKRSSRWRGGGRELLATVTRIYEFRNTRVAHQEKEVIDPKEAQQHLTGWINGLKALTEALS
jgi:hypothetical protein